MLVAVQPLKTNNFRSTKMTIIDPKKIAIAKPLLILPLLIILIFGSQQIYI